MAPFGCKKKGHEVFQVSSGFQGYSRCFQFLLHFSSLTVHHFFLSFCLYSLSKFFQGTVLSTSHQNVLFSPKWFPLSSTGFILLPAHMNLKRSSFCSFSLYRHFLPSFLFFLLLSVLRSHRGHRQQRVVDLLPVRRPRAVSQQLLDGDPVVEDAAIPLLHALLLAQ